METTAHLPGPSSTPISSPDAAPRSWRAGIAPLAAPLPHAHRLLTRVLCRGIMLTFGQLLEVEHAARLAALPEPAIFALNHSGSLEALLVPAALIYLRAGRPVHFLADWMYLAAPGLGWLLRQSEPVPVYGKRARFGLGERHRRERLRRPVLDACRRHLERGESLGIFPEGTRNRRSAGLLRGRLGLGELALAAAAPVVPATIRYPARARLGRAPRIGRLVLTIGEPLEFAAERRQAAADPAARRGLARLVTERVMAALATQLAQTCLPPAPRAAAAPRTPRHLAGSPGGDELSSSAAPTGSEAT
jgi:1-acyl-sn-glycerol-3-phosphate acyltransferase